MNKKFLVVALMAALSTVGYAYTPVEETKIEETTNRAFEEVEKDVNSLKNEVGNLKDFRNETSLAVGTLQNQMIDANGKIGDIKGDVDGIKGQVGNINESITDINGKLEGKLDRDEFVQAQENIYDSIKGAMDYSDGKDRLQDEKIDEADQKANTAIEKAEAADKKADTAIGKAEAADKKADTAIGKAEAADKKADTAIGKADVAGQKAETNRQNIEKLEQDFAKYDGRLSGLEKKVDNLDNKMNKGLSLMAAMNAVDFQNVQTGEMAIGAGVGHYGNAQSVALGVAYSPVEDLTVNAKYSVTAGDVDSFALGAGATYKFKVGR